MATSAPEQSPPRRGKKPRPTRRSSFWGRLGVLVLVPFVFYTVYTVADKSVQTYRMRQEASAIRSEVEAERQENLRLQRELDEARGDQQIEAQARRELNLIKPGDQPVVLLGPLPTPSPTPATPPRAQPSDTTPPWLVWLLKLIGA